jgi:prephenate dehydrogenase
MPIRQITIIGTGLIGGSFALAIKRTGFTGRIVGCDRPEVLTHARQSGAIDAAVVDARAAVLGSDVVLLATPVHAIMDLMALGRECPNSLFTDVGSTKREIVSRAQEIFGTAANKRFLAGHPMAGKEYSGVEHADADLFRDAVWIFSPLPGQDTNSGICANLIQLVRGIGASPVFIDADRQDELCAWTSHLPQLVSTALATALSDALDDDPLMAGVGGRALREMTRLAASPYSMWRDIVFTNTGNIEQALLRLEQRLAHIRENLRTRELESEFELAQRLRTRITKSS